MKKTFPRLLFILVLFASASQVKAASQDTLVPDGANYLQLNGRVLKSEGQMRDDEKSILDSAVVCVLNESGMQIMTLRSDKKGKVNFRLPLNRKFTVRITKNGFVSKLISIDTKVNNSERKNYDFAFDVDIFESVPGLDVSVLKTPVARIVFKPIDKEFSYDMAYTNHVNAGLQKMYREYYTLKRKEVAVSDSVPSHAGAPKASGTKKSVPYGKNNKPH